MPIKESLIASVGDRFGRLVVLETGIRQFSRAGANIIYCRVRCDCGRELMVIKKNLFRKSTSCGCLRREMVAATNYKHGRTGHQLYGTWQGMIKRCYNAANTDYPDYGGRGIAMCDAWRHIFTAFYDWAIPAGYQPGLTIERIDVNGHYEPHNCRFILMSEQANNKRSNTRITCFGETKTEAKWARDSRCVVDASTLSYRIRAGWDAKDALTLPADYHNRPLHR